MVESCGVAIGDDLDDAAGEHRQVWEWPGGSACTGEGEEAQLVGAVGVFLSFDPEDWLPWLVD